MPGPSPSSRFGLTVVATSVPMFMASLDNLVMTFALPVIQREFQASVIELQWFVNSYTIAFATLMLPMAALGDRYGRVKVFLSGIVLFCLASIAAAFSSSAAWLIAARALQGVGAAAIVPLSLTLLSVGVPAAKRALAIGIWGGVNGLGIAVGPLIGGAVVQGLHWTGIFWLNVPLGILAVPLALFGLRESRGAATRLDAPGVLAGIVFVLPLIWAVVEGRGRGWTSLPILAAFTVSGIGLVAFLIREVSSPAAFVPLRLFRDRMFTLSNLAGLLSTAGVFGAIFMLSQSLQISMGYGAFDAGLRAAPWTLAPMVVAPFAGLLVQRFGVRPVLVVGLGLQTVAVAVIALCASASLPYPALVLPMIAGGIGMGLTFSPLSTAVLIGRPEHEQGVASGVNSTLRQLGTAAGIAVCTVVFTSNGAYLPGQPFIDGMVPALFTCVAMLGVAAVLAACLPRRHGMSGGAFSGRGTPEIVLVP